MDSLLNLLYVASLMLPLLLTQRFLLDLPYAHGYLLADVLAKVTVCHRGCVLAKLKTKKKQGSCSPIFNEALSCVVDPSKLKDVKVEITLLNDSSKAKRREMGCLTLGPQTSGEQLRHWNDMLASPGKHLSEWHELHSF